MTNLTALINTARTANLAETAARNSAFPKGSVLTEGNITVRIVPVQPRGMNSWKPSCIRADVYINGERVKTEDLKAMLKAEAA